MTRKTAFLSQRTLTILGWGGSLAGTLLWLYGYVSHGTPSVVNWKAYTPWWISGFLPNLEAELGMVLIVLTTVLLAVLPRR
jgi:hypothetical protein